MSLHSVLVVSLRCRLPDLPSLGPLFLMVFPEVVGHSEERSASVEEVLLRLRVSLLHISRQVLC